MRVNVSLFYSVFRQTVKIECICMLFHEIFAEQMKYCSTEWKKNDKFSFTEKKFRQIKYLVIPLVKPLLSRINYLVIFIVKLLFSRIFCQKSMRVNFRNFHTVPV